MAFGMTNNTTYKAFTVLITRLFARKQQDLDTENEGGQLFAYRWWPAKQELRKICYNIFKF
jgi:hypothetical protein